MRTFALVALVLAVTELRGLAAEAAADKQAAADVAMLVAWVAGAGDAKVFAEPFPAAKSIAGAKDVMFYSDVTEVDLPQQFRAATFESIQPLLSDPRRGKATGPALSVTRAVEADPPESRMTEVIRQRGHNQRFYFIELSIDEHTSSTAKVEIYSSSGQTRVRLLSSAVNGKSGQMHIAAAEPPTPEERAANDVTVLAAWIAGTDYPDIFPKPFGDGQFIKDATDAVFYTDVDDVTVPKKLRQVTYQHIKSRMEAVRSGNRGSPAVLITRSVEGNPDDDVLVGGAKENEKRIPGARYYSIEVAIGNMAWHWMKVRVYEVDGKTKVEFLRRAVS